MPSRYRERSIPYTYLHQSPNFAGSGNAAYERFLDPLPGPGPCSHFKSSLTPIGYDYGTNTSWRVSPLPAPEVAIPSLPWVESMNWDKLPSSTQSGIIQILAELDDTLAMFTKRFWRALNYGAWTWGVVPFVSDLIAVADAVGNIGIDLDSFSYEDQFNIDLPASEPNGANPWVWAGGQAKIRYTGKADMSFQLPGSIALDWLGFHPDLATAWDLIPFSFVVDYLIPIGDFLEQFRSGGWVKTVYFTGWQTVSLQGEVKYDYGEPYTCFGSASVSTFSRHYGGFVLTVDTDIDPLMLEIPSYREMFNLLYLLFS